MTKLVRFVQRGPRYVGLSPLKMVQLKPHCSDAAALERDTRQALHRKPEANSLSDAHLLAITKVQPVLFFPVIEISPLIDAFGVRLRLSVPIYEILRHRRRRPDGWTLEGRSGKFILPIAVG